MAHYLVEAKPIDKKLEELRKKLYAGEIRKMRPFGNTVQHSLSNARIQPDGYAVWEELDYCNPPLAMEREAVLDIFFSDLSVKNVNEGEGWSEIEELPRLWEMS